MHKQTYSSTALAEIRKELSEPSVGNAEFGLAFQKAVECSKDSIELVRNIDAEVRSYRDSRDIALTGRVVTTRTSDSLREFYAACENSARAELLSGSTEIQTLNRLESEALEAQRKANQKKLELTKLFDQFSALPERAARLVRKLESTRATKESLDEASLRAEFKRQFRLQWSDGTIGAFNHVDTAALLVTRGERMEVLNDLEIETTRELEQLRDRNKVLARQLGRPRWLF
jgi:hypothetical protein